MSPIPNEVFNALYLVGRNIIDDATGGKSDVSGLWRLWDSCMNDTACKVVAIVLIVIGSIIVIWVLGTIFRCFYYGLACGDACCACCCCCGLNKRSQDNYPPQYYEKPATLVYANPNMYPAQQPPMYPPQYQQERHNNPGAGYNYFNQSQGYEPMYPNDENTKYRQAF